MSVHSIDGVAQVSVVRGAQAALDAVPRLLIEVPHGACRRAHYDACREQLGGTFPDQLEHFFHANTDEGAWELGCSAARQLVERRPELTVQLIRCLVPRTFIDCNRVIDVDHRLRRGDAGALSKTSDRPSSGAASGLLRLVDGPWHGGG